MFEPRTREERDFLDVLTERLHTRLLPLLHAELSTTDFVTQQIQDKADAIYRQLLDEWPARLGVDNLQTMRPVCTFARKSKNKKVLTINYTRVEREMSPAGKG